MQGAALRRIGFCLALAALAGCGLKGDPEPPQPERAESAR